MNDDTTDDTHELSRMQYHRLTYSNLCNHNQYLYLKVYLAWRNMCYSKIKIYSIRIYSKQNALTNLIQFVQTSKENK